METLAREAVVAKVAVPDGMKLEKEMRQEINLVEAEAQKLVISTDEEYERAAEIGKQIKAKAKAVTDFFKPMKDQAHKAHKELCNREKELLKPLKDTEAFLKKGMTEYYQAKERKRLELEEKIKRAASEECERKLDEAVEQEAAGCDEAAVAALIDAQIAETATNATVRIDKPKVKGVSNTKDWEIFEIDNEKVPVNFAGNEIRPVDEKEIMKLIRESNGTIQIPGVQYRAVTKISIRRH